MARALSAGNEGFAAGHIQPLRQLGIQQGLLAAFQVDVGHPGVQVELAHGVADDFAGFAHRQVVLLVFSAPLPVAVHLALPAAVDQGLRQVEIFFIPGDPVQLDQGRFDLGMPGVAVAFARAKDIVDVVGKALGHAQQAGPAGYPKMGHCGLDQVPGAVHFMVAGQVGPALVGFEYLVVGVQVAVRHLCRRHQRDDFIDQCFQRGVGPVGEIQ